MTHAHSPVVDRDRIARDVLRGLSGTPKSLPPYLFYDAAGSALYERITALEEYYPTRTERAILTQHAGALVALAAEGSPLPLSVIELGAGSATKTRLVLEAVVALQGRCVYLPVDVSSAALAEAQASLEAALPAVEVRPFVGHHTEAFGAMAALAPRRMVLFIGSSVGNLTDDEAVGLLGGVRGALSAGDVLLLGTDLRKDPARLVPAYDDALGVTAAFNKNVLARLNRELGADFDLARFRHVALWNDAASRVEMHLESAAAQEVRLEALGLTVAFGAGERIHTESSVKYDQARVDAIVRRSGFARKRTVTDAEGLFAVHLARVEG